MYQNVLCQVWNHGEFMGAVKHHSISILGKEQQKHAVKHLVLCFTEVMRVWNNVMCVNDDRIFLFSSAILIQICTVHMEGKTWNEKSAAALKLYQRDLILVCSKDYKEEIHPALQQRERLSSQFTDQN